MDGYSERKKKSSNANENLNINLSKKFFKEQTKDKNQDNPDEGVEFLKKNRRVMKSWTDLMSLENIPYDTREKVLKSYKKIVVKPFKIENDIFLEDFESDQDL